MERRRQARTPVDINALLIGEKTVPKGCHVMNVSQNGMQLKCDADGRLLTFKEGDSVDVHLTIKHEGKTRKIAIPSWVRHVDANTIDVEFHKPDPMLVDLIESYRVSEQHKLEASLGRLDRRVISSRATVSTNSEKVSGQTAKHAQKQNNRPFYTVILATVFAVCVITGGYVYTASIDSRISTLETLSKRQSTELVDIQSRVFSASLQEGRYASLNARMTAIIDAIISLEDRLDPEFAEPVTSPLHKKLLAADNTAIVQQQTATVTGSGSVAATNKESGNGAATIRMQGVSGQIATTPEAAKTPSQKPTSQEGSLNMPTIATPDKTDIPPAKPEAQAAGLTLIARPESSTSTTDTNGTATGKKQRIESKEVPTAAHDSPWVINLLSSTDKAYVEQFSKKTDATKHNAVLNSAMVNGKEYWRLQITGFDSAAAARKQASTVKQELGIKDVWIFKQK